MTEEPLSPEPEANLETEYLDLDVFKPKPFKHVQIEGVTYGVMHPADLTFDQWLELLENDGDISRLEDEPRKASAAGKKKVAMLIPGLPSEVLESLNPRRLLLLVGFVTTEVKKAAKEQHEQLESERPNGDAGAEAASEPAAPLSNSAS
jgi:hypothetical protein